MAELWSSRRSNNYVASGRRVYANPNNVHSTDQQERHESGKRAVFSGDKVGMVRESNKSNGNGMQGKGWRLGRTESGHSSPSHGDGALDDEFIRQAAALLLVRMKDFVTADLCESCSASVEQRLASIAAGDFGLDNISHPKRVPALVDDDQPFEATSFPLSVDVMEERTLLKSSSQTMPRTRRKNGSAFDRLGPKVNSSTAESIPAKESPASPSIDDSRVTSDMEVSIPVKDTAKLISQNNDRNGVLVGSSGKELDDCRRISTLAVGSNDLVIKKTLLMVGSGPAYNTRSMSRKAAIPEPPAKLVGSATEGSDHARIALVVRKKDFCQFERVKGQNINILEGLELHANVFNKEEQDELVDYIYELQQLGRNQKLRRRTYSEPRKWMRGKGRVTLQFGCCYNYAMDKDGNPPGIMREEEVDPIPPKFRMVIKRLVQWQVLPPICVPDSCIVNIYDVGDCIPPHIDHHDFVRPFCTLSLLSECDIIFGANLKIVGPGEFKGSFSIPLPTGSVLILNGNGANVAKHSVPAVPTQRISITFRKMDPTKIPVAFAPDKELLSTRPLTMVASEPNSNSLAEHTADNLRAPLLPSRHQSNIASEISQPTFDLEFPPLGQPSRHLK